jgi:dephospho-CoA kinase
VLKVGITGGIGSGKSTVCQVFETLGIPVLYADQLAIDVIENDPLVGKNLENLFGPETYIDGVYNKKFISKKVFDNPTLLQQLNSITHPAIITQGDKWMDQQKSKYVLKEAALFFESKSHVNMDIMIGVAAPLDQRIQAIKKRNQFSENEIKKRIDQQMPQDEKMNLCDYVILNDMKKSIIQQVLALHQMLLNHA